MSRPSFTDAVVQHAKQTMNVKHCNEGVCEDRLQAVLPTSASRTPARSRDASDVQRPG
jgi:hypothetical protein